MGKWKPSGCSPLGAALSCEQPVLRKRYKAELGPHTAEHKVPCSAVSSRSEPHEELPRVSRTNPKGISGFLSLFPDTHQRETGEELESPTSTKKCQYSHRRAEGWQGKVTLMLRVTGHPKCRRGMNACHRRARPHTNQSKSSFIDCLPSNMIFRSRQTKAPLWSRGGTMACLKRKEIYI